MQGPTEMSGRAQSFCDNTGVATFGLKQEALSAGFVVADAAPFWPRSDSAAAHGRAQHRRRCRPRQSPGRRLTCLDGEARDPQGDVALLAHGTGWMSPYQRDRYFEYGVLDRA